MPEYIHVKDNKTGHEFPWPAHLVEGVKGVTPTGKDALGPDGRPVAPKHKTTVEKSAAAKKNSAPKSPAGEPGQQADTTKEID